MRMSLRSTGREAITIAGVIAARHTEGIGLVDRMAAKMIAFVAFDVIVVVAMLTMDMLVRDLFVGCGADFGDIESKSKRHAGQRMITVQNHLILSDIRYGKDQ